MSDATPSDPMLPPKGAAAELGVSLASLWRAVQAGRLPAPIYVTPAAPRWIRSELRAALPALRSMPSAAKVERRRAAGRARHQRQAELTAGAAAQQAA